MAQQTINVGSAPNDGTGTPLRTAFQYTNSNFSELYTALGGGSGLPGATTQVIFNDGGTNLAGDAGLVYNKTTDALTIGGNVQAASGTITGDLTVDTTTLKVDAANNVVGAGVVPGAAIGNLQIGGSANANLYVQQGTDTVRMGVRSSGRTGILLDSSDATYTNRAWYLDNVGSSGSLIIGRQGLDVVTFTNTGNLGLGVAPSAWSGGKAFEAGLVGNYFVGSTVSSYTSIGTAAYYNGTNWIYARSTAASKYELLNNTHAWFTAPSGTAGNAITFTQAMTLNANGALALQGGNTSANGVGIAFPATQVASSDANTLDDYEEGTWTGTLTGGTTNPTTPVTATGRYTKIGRQVSIQIEFSDVNTTGASGAINVTGVPFANCLIVTFGVLQSSLGATFTGALGCYLLGSGVILVASETIPSSFRADVNHNPGTGRYFWFEMTYTVA